MTEGVTDGTFTQPLWKFARPHVLTGNAWVIVPSGTPFYDERPAARRLERPPVFAEATQR